MKLQQKRKRGIMLVVALLTAVVVLMFLGAALKLVPSQLGETVHSREKAAADAAARSGAAYAMSRLQENANWRGDENNRLVVDTPSLKVLEDRGNVIGYLLAADGTRSQFQIRFNYQNGLPATGQWDDGLPDPTHPLLISGISQNNLSGSAPVDVPAISTSMTSASGSGFAVDSSSVVSLKAPRYSCVVQVVGLAGRGIGATGVGNRLGSVTSEAKAVFSRSEMNKYDAVAYFGGGLTANLYGLDGATGSLALDSVDSRPSKLRTISSVTLDAGDVSGSSTSQLILGETGVLTRPSTSNNQVRTSQESLQQQRDHWPKTTWDDVPKADPTHDSTLPAGTFVWRHDPSASSYVVDYYAQAVDSTHPPTGLPTTYTQSDFNQHFPNAVRMDGDHLTLEFKDKVYVNPVGGLKSFRVTYDDTVGLAGLRPLNNFAANSGRKAILTSTGDVALDGVSRGQGAVTSEGSIQFQSSSIFEADPNSNVAIYAKGDVTLTPPSGVQTAAFNEYINQGSNALVSSGGNGGATTGGGGSTSDAKVGTTDVSAITTSLIDASTTFDSAAVPPPTFVASAQTAVINPGVAWSNAQTALTYTSTGGGFTIAPSPTALNINLLTTALTNVRPLTWTPTGGYNVNPSSVAFTPAALSLFSPSKLVNALTFSSTGLATVKSIVSPVMLQALKIEPQFPITSNDIGFSGLIYAQGNLNADIRNANFFMNGVLCIWGGDPAVDAPGTAGRGKANVTCLNTYFNYDPSCLLKESGGTTAFATKLDQTYFSLK